MARKRPGKPDGKPEPSKGGKPEPSKGGKDKHGGKPAEDSRAATLRKKTRARELKQAEFKRRGKKRRIILIVVLLLILLIGGGIIAYVENCKTENEELFKEIVRLIVQDQNYREAIRLMNDEIGTLGVDVHKLSEYYRYCRTALDYDVARNLKVENRRTDAFAAYYHVLTWIPLARRELEDGADVLLTEIFGETPAGEGEIPHKLSLLRDRCTTEVDEIKEEWKDEARVLIEQSRQTDDEDEQIRLLGQANGVLGQIREFFPDDAEIEAMERDNLYTIANRLTGQQRWDEAITPHQKARRLDQEFFTKHLNPVPPDFDRDQDYDRELKHCETEWDNFRWYKRRTEDLVRIGGAKHSIFTAEIAWTIMPNSDAGASLEQYARGFARMRFIPPGQFIFAAAPGQAEYWEILPEQERQRRLPGFYIDPYEVLNIEYKVAVQTGAVPAPLIWEGGEVPLRGRGQPTPQGRPGWVPVDPDFDPAFNWDRHFNYPACGIRWTEASSYATAVGKQLPSQEEWEKAARGRNGRIFPWGDEMLAELANLGQQGLAPVGADQDGRSPFYCFDMAGNVAEWTRDQFDRLPGSDQQNNPHYGTGRMVYKGGSYRNVLFGETFRRPFMGASDRNDYIGIRLVKRP